MRIGKVLCFVTVWLMNLSVGAQNYLGVSANFGNRMHYAPQSEGLRRPIAISGSLTLIGQEKLNNDWFFQYGASLGILGYAIKILSMDTLSSVNDASAFWDYSIFYGSLHLLAGKEISVGKKKLMMGLGGGVTYYLGFEGLISYGVGLIDNDNVDWELFYAEVNYPENRFAAFAKGYMQLALNPSLAIGLGYTHHFKPVLAGSYEFYYTKTPSAGKMSLYQREVNLVFLVKISRD